VEIMDTNGPVNGIIINLFLLPSFLDMPIQVTGWNFLPRVIITIGMHLV
jgi:hypothetical protein